MTSFRTDVEKYLAEKARQLKEENAMNSSYSTPEPNQYFEKGFARNELGPSPPLTPPITSATEDLHSEIRSLALQFEALGKRLLPYTMKSAGETVPVGATAAVRPLCEAHDKLVSMRIAVAQIGASLADLMDRMQL
jgi:hypothetical protein